MLVLSSKTSIHCQVPVAHTYNPSCSGAEIRRIKVGSQLWQIVFKRPYLKKSITKKELVEWLKVKALSSSHSTTKKNPPFIKGPR
jgi:hypothetical protein